MGTSALPEERLDRVFDKWWPELEACLSIILQSSEIIKSKRSDEDMVKEVLEIVRDQQKILTKMLETHINYAEFVVESTSDRTDKIRVSPFAAFNNEFLKKYTCYESWYEAVSDIKKNLGEDIDPLNFVLSDWPESLSSNIGFADWNDLRRAAIIEWALKNATISAKMW
jgi:hydroxymethylpyrimidine pyrophosphatase-like HAD family hydrolase